MLPTFLGDQNTFLPGIVEQSTFHKDFFCWRFIFGFLSFVFYFVYLTPYQREKKRSN